MGDLKMKTLVLGMVQTNTYVIRNVLTKEAIVVDPADHAEKIYEYIKSNDLVCKSILLTHGHFDHIMAAKELAELTQVKIYAHEAEEKLLSTPNMNASPSAGVSISLTPDVFLKDQEEFLLAGFDIKVIHTPGHTAGGACYYFTKHNVLISGDTLFHECIGRSDLPTGNGRVLVESIKHKLLTLGDDVEVYPGHGIPTTIGHEKVRNPYLSGNIFID